MVKKSKVALSRERVFEHINRIRAELEAAGLTTAEKKRIGNAIYTYYLNVDKGETKPDPTAPLLALPRHIKRKKSELEIPLPDVDPVEIRNRTRTVGLVDFDAQTQDYIN